MSTRATVSWNDMHASFMVSAPDTPTVIHDNYTVMGTYISFVEGGVCTVYYHTWNCAWYWRSLIATAPEAAAVTGCAFVFIDNDRQPQSTYMIF